MAKPLSGYLGGKERSTQESQNPRLSTRTRASKPSANARGEVPVMTGDGLRYVAIVALAFALLAWAAPARATDHRYDNTRWVKLWQKRDQSVWTSIPPAATTFQVSSGTMRTIVEREGGNVASWKLQRNLCTGGQPGWNNIGSYAFGPYQYMLGSKPACNGYWGTFGAHDDQAFHEARARGLNVPYRFKTPASNVGQSIVTAYLIRKGQLCVHWSATLC